MIGATLALVLDDFKSYEQYLTTIIGSRLLVRAQRMFFMVQQPHFHTFWCWMIFAKEKLYGRFLWMAFHCLNNTEPIWGESLLFTTESPGFVLSQTWSHPSVFNQGLLDWKSSSLNTRPLQHQMHKNSLRMCSWPVWHLDGDIGDQQWQLIFSLFVNLVEKKITFSRSICCHYMAWRNYEPI